MQLTNTWYWECKRPVWYFGLKKWRGYLHRCPPCPKSRGGVGGRPPSPPVVTPMLIRRNSCRNFQV